MKYKTLGVAVEAVRLAVLQLAQFGAEQERRAPGGPPVALSAPDQRERLGLGEPTARLERRVGAGNRDRDRPGIGRWPNRKARTAELAF